MRGSQLIGLNLVMRQRGQWHSMWVIALGGKLLDGGVQGVHEPKHNRRFISRHSRPVCAQRSKVA